MVTPGQPLRSHIPALRAVLPLKLRSTEEFETVNTTGSLGLEVSLRPTARRVPLAPD